MSSWLVLLFQCSHRHLTFLFIIPVIVFTYYLKSDIYACYVPIVFVFFGFGSEMWGGFIFFKGKERPMGLISHTSHTLIIQSFQHSSWITSAHSLVHLVQILKHLCEWKLSLPVQSEMKQAPGPACIISYEKKEQILRKHHKSVSRQQQLWETKHHQQVDLRYCKQMNIYIYRYIYK